MKRSEALQIIEKSYTKWIWGEQPFKRKDLYKDILSRLEKAGMKPPEINDGLTRHSIKWVNKWENEDEKK